VVAPEIRKRLTDDELTEVTAALWPVDCQSCGKSLRSSRPSLVVDDMMAFASVSLHHGRCRASEWNDGMVMRDGGALLSFATLSMLLPIGRSGAAEPDPFPTLLVNPGLEMVLIEKDQVGRWRVQPPAMFTQAGLVPPGRDLELDRPVAGAVARTPRHAVAVTLEVPPYPTYDAHTQDDVAARIHEVGGVLLLVTHAVHPHQVRDLAQLTPLMRDGRAAPPVGEGERCDGLIWPQLGDPGVQNMLLSVTFPGSPVRRRAMLSMGLWLYLVC
jgi:hypothetical protein